MKLIKQIYDLMTLATDKGITRYHTGAEVMDTVDMAQMDFFRDCLVEFPKNKRIRNILLPFQKKSSVTISGATGALPSDFEHEIEGYSTATGVDYPVTFEELGFFNTKVNDPVDPPSTHNVIACVYYDSAKKIKVAPSTITAITLHYFKRPVKPVFGTTGATYSYDDSTSTDVEWSALYHDIITEKALRMLGINMRDLIVLRESQKTKPLETNV